MKVLVIGGDGYCGWATALHLADNGMQVVIADNFARRAWDGQLGVASLTPIASMDERLACWNSSVEHAISFVHLDVTEYEPVCALLEEMRPDAVVHFAQQRSAPYSMIDRDHAVQTLVNNTVGNLNLLWALREAAPDAHLVKLGTMGEYGTPNIDIEEGFIEITHKGRTDTLPFPKQPGSFYHLTKVHDSDQLYFVCRAWGLRATDLHQGVVYGVHTPQTARAPQLINRFDYDHVFGTALNRFCVEAAVGHPLTVYGTGGQTRSFLNIRDTVRCVELALRNPAQAGQYRVFNQFTELFSVADLARAVARVGETMGLTVKVEHQENPRFEKERHHYETRNANLRALGLQPTLLEDGTLREMIELAMTFKDRVDPAVIRPSISWKPRAKAASILSA
ncbi:MAG TPA: NAD-dependent epimerase/dehydratase family protein [Candidatus Baltobacteraceae bacterium]|jgi:UDP-sulfoquinovose synthase|nr:NAD-dependent epimerase/dehydratase family protein [Candidatus Baltobacteraceae bacterium]